MLMEETVFSQAVIDLNQTFYKDDVRYFDLDKLAGLPYGPGASLGFTQWTDAKLPPATDANIQIDTSNPMTVLNVPDFAIPSSWTPIATKLRKISGGTYVLVTLFKLPTNNYVIRSIYYDNGNLHRRYISDNLLTAPQLAIPNFICHSDMTYHNQFIVILCGSLTTGDFVFIRYTTIPNFPIIGSQHQSPFSFTMPMDALCPINPANIAIRWVDAFFDKSGTSKYYQFLVVFNRIPIAEYNPLPSAALQSSSRCAYIVNIEENRFKLFHFPSIETTVFTSDHFATDMMMHADGAIGRVRLYVWAYKVTDMKFNLITYGIDLDQPTTTTRTPFPSGGAMLRATPTQNFIGMLMFAHSHIDYCIGIVVTQPRLALFMEIYITPSLASDSLGPFYYSNPLYKNRLPIISYTDASHYDLDGSIRGFNFMYEEKVGTTAYTILETHFMIMSSVLKQQRTSILARKGPASSFVGIVEMVANVPVLIVESSQILLFNNSVFAPGSNDRSFNLVLDLSKYPQDIVQNLPIKHSNSRVPGVLTESSYSLRFISTNLMWRLEVPTLPITNRASVFTNRWNKVAIDLYDVKGVYSNVSAPDLLPTYNSFLVGENILKLFTSSGVISQANTNILYTGRILFTKTNPPSQTNVIVYECTPKLDLSSVPDVSSSCIQSGLLTSATVTQSNYLNHRHFEDGTLIVAYRESSSAVNFYWYQPFASPSVSTWSYSIPGGSIADVGYYFNSSFSSGSTASTRIFIVTAENNPACASKWCIRVYQMGDNYQPPSATPVVDTGEINLDSPSGSSRTLTFPALSQILTISSIFNMKVLTLAPSTDGYIPHIYTFNQTGTNKISYIYESTVEFKRGNDVRTNEAVKMCYFEAPDPNNSTSIVPYILYYYTGGSPFARVAKGVNNTLESFGLGLTDLGVTAVVSASCFPHQNIAVLVTKRAVNLLAIVIDITRIEDPEKRFKHISEFGNSAFATANVHCAREGCYVSAPTATSGYVRSILYSYSLYVKPLVNTNFLLEVKIRNYNTSIVLKLLNFNMTPSALPTVSSVSPTVLQTINPLPGTSYSIDNLINFNNHVFNAKLIANTSYSVDVDMIKLTPRLQFERSLLFARRRLLKDLNKEYKTSQHSKRVLQGYTPQPMPTLVVTKSNITLILFDSNNQLPARSVIYVFNQTVNFETTIDKLPVICKGIDFVLQPPLTLHIFLVCEDQYLRYLRASVDKMDTSSTRLFTYTANKYNSDKILIAWNGDTLYDTFYATLIDYNEVGKTYRMLGTKVAQDSIQVQERFSASQVLAHSLIFVPYLERIWVCGVYRSSVSFDDKNEISSICLDNNTLALGTDSLTAKVAVVGWVGNTSMPVQDISCLNSNMTKAEVICDLSLQGPEVVELVLQLVPAPTRATLSLVSNTTYIRHGENFAHMIASGVEYFACATYSFTDAAYNNILLFKRTRLPGGSSLVYYSIPASDVTPSAGSPAASASISFRASGQKSSPIEMLSMTLFNSPLDGKPRLLAVDTSSGSLAKIYTIQPLTLQIGNVGYSEMLRWKDMNLTINLNYQLGVNYSLYDLLFNPNSTPKDVRDIGRWDFFSILKYWLYGFLILVLVATPIGIYFYRREKLKKYTGAT